MTYASNMLLLSFIITTTTIGYTSQDFTWRSFDITAVRSALYAVSIRKQAFSFPYAGIHETFLEHICRSAHYLNCLTDTLFFMTVFQILTVINFLTVTCVVMQCTPGDEYQCFIEHDASNFRAKFFNSAHGDIMFPFCIFLSHKEIINNRTQEALTLVLWHPSACALLQWVHLGQSEPSSHTYPAKSHALHNVTTYNRYS